MNVDVWILSCLTGGCMNVYGYIFGFLLDRWFYVIVVVILPDKWFCDFFYVNNYNWGTKTVTVS